MDREKTKCGIPTLTLEAIVFRNFKGLEKPLLPLVMDITVGIKKFFLDKKQILTLN